MRQFDYIKDIAKYGLENDHDRLLTSINELIDYSKQNKKVNFAIQLQSILKDTLMQNKNNLSRYILHNCNPFVSLHVYIHIH